MTGFSSIGAAGAMRAALVLGVMGALISSAGADDLSMGAGDVRAVGGGYELYFPAPPSLDHFKNSALHVRKGARSAGLGIGPFHLQLELSANAVKLSYMPMCEDVEQTFTHAQLEARLDHEEGVQLASQGKHAAAITLFTRAATLDPSHQPAYRDHAAALVKLGRPDEAIAVLAAKRPAHPMAAYVQLALDAPLSPLLGRPQLAHLRAAKRGTAKITGASSAIPALTMPPVARAPGGELAFLEVTGSHGACFAFTRLVIRDGKSLAELTSLSLINGGEYADDGCDQKAPFTKAGVKAVRAKVALANQTLAALGFTPPAVEQGKVEEEMGMEVKALRFAKHGVRLEAGPEPDPAVRVLQRGKLLAQHPPGAINLGPFFEQAALILDEQRILISTMSRGCYHSESISVQAVPLR